MSENFTIREFCSLNILEACQHQIFKETEPEPQNFPYFFFNFADDDFSIFRADKISVLKVSVSSNIT